jgi:hypothetical protein
MGKTHQVPLPLHPTTPLSNMRGVPMDKNHCTHLHQHLPHVLFFFFFFFFGGGV